MISLLLLYLCLSLRQCKKTGVKSLFSGSLSYDCMWYSSVFHVIVSHKYIYWTDYVHSYKTLIYFIFPRFQTWSKKINIFLTSFCFQFSRVKTCLFPGLNYREECHNPFYGRVQTFIFTVKWQGARFGERLNAAAQGLDQGRPIQIV